MKKTKSQSGITLIALIITILVLLILAGVAIKSIKDGGIITKAQQAADKYTQAQEDELAMLDEYVAEIELINPKIGKVEGIAQGGFITYNGGLYVVLYNDNVEGLQIVATKVADKPLTLNGFNDWENRFEKFKEACAPYVKKSLGAIEGRVLGATFNEMKVNNNNGQFMYKEENGNIRPLKLYGNIGSGLLGKDATVAGELLQQAGAALEGKEIWCSTADLTASGSNFIIETINTENGAFPNKQLAKYKAEAETTADMVVVSSYGDVSATSNILPVILLDSRIKVTGGTGTASDPYTFEFNK